MGVTVALDARSINGGDMSVGKRVVTTGITATGTGSPTVTTRTRGITVTTRRRAISSQYAGNLPGYFCSSYSRLQKTAGWLGRTVVAPYGYGVSRP